MIFIYHEAHQIVKANGKWALCKSSNKEMQQDPEMIKSSHVTWWILRVSGCVAEMPDHNGTKILFFNLKGLSNLNLCQQNLLDAVNVQLWQMLPLQTV